MDMHMRSFRTSLTFRMLLIALSTVSSITPSVSAQDAEKYYKQGVDKAVDGKLEEAIVLFSKTIELAPDDAYAWYNRGIAKSELGRCGEALPDFDRVVELAPSYKKVYLNRGICRKHLSQNEDALADYTAEIALDSAYAEAYYNRGLLRDLMNQRDAACEDFSQAGALGLSAAQRQFEQCSDTLARAQKIHVIHKLTRMAPDGNYGFSPEQPVKVGHGPNGGPANQRAYLDLLRDGKGEPVTYKRTSSCCAYVSEPVYDLLRRMVRNASTMNCRLVLSLRSQFFQSLRHFSSQAKDRSTTQRLGMTAKVCNSLRLATSTSAPMSSWTACAKFSPL